MARNQEATMLKGEPYIFKVLDCSTGHMTKEDAQKLGDDNNMVPSYELEEYGWLVYSEGWTDDPSQYEGMSPAFIKVLEWANELECNYVRFDRDGYTYDTLPMFEW